MSARRKNAPKIAFATIHKVAMSVIVSVGFSLTKFRTLVATLTSAARQTLAKGMPNVSTHREISLVSAKQDTLDMKSAMTQTNVQKERIIVTKMPFVSILWVHTLVNVRKDANYFADSDTE